MPKETPNNNNSKLSDSNETQVTDTLKVHIMSARQHLKSKWYNLGATWSIRFASGDKIIARLSHLIDDLEIKIWDTHVNLKNSAWPTTFTIWKEGKPTTRDVNNKADLNNIWNKYIKPKLQSLPSKNTSARIDRKNDVMSA